MRTTRCRRCAYHCYVKQSKLRRDLVFKHFKKDDARFFEENFSKTVLLFHCSGYNLFHFLILDSALAVIHFVLQTYPHTNRTEGASLFGALVMLMEGKRSLKPQQVDELFSYGLLKPELYLQNGETLLERSFRTTSIILFLNTVRYSKSRPPVVCNAHYNSFIKNTDRLLGPPHLVRLFYTHFCHELRSRKGVVEMWFPPITKTDAHIPLKLRLLSFHILKAFYMICMGSEFKIHRPSPFYPDCNEEFLNILNAFEYTCRNMSLFSLSRRRLYNVAPSFKSLSRYVELFGFSSSSTERILLQNVSVVNDAKNLQMKTLAHVYEHEKRTLVFDKLLECGHCTQFRRMFAHEMPPWDAAD